MIRRFEGNDLASLSDVAQESRDSTQLRCLRSLLSEHIVMPSLFAAPSKQQSQ